MSTPAAHGDHYSVLGVAPDASTEEIKKAFRALARQCHPDVAGSDPEAVARFKRIKKAYDTLVDPGSRQKYDRRRTRSKAPRMPGGFYFWGDQMPGQEPPPSQDRYSKDRGNDLDLDDIFGDHGGFVDFGFGGAGPSSGSRAQREGERPMPGGDIHMNIDVPADVAAKGGLVTVTYSRRRRTEDGRGVVNYDEIYDVRVPPGARTGVSLRCEGWGHAGTGGGPYGDLVCDVRVVGQPGAQARGSGASGGGGRRSAGQGSSGRRAQADPEAPRVVPISIQEALLGGRIELDTPQGAVVLNLPPCTSGGARFRLRGKGEPGPEGLPGDLFIQLRVVTPPLLDLESEQLIEQFAELNPYNPRDD
ncbi:MAG: J domain-containing protein [Alphaproteobacteria bacterium]|nr:J domain-containing protein [Alphaproteobacteria bacterium]